MSLLSASRRHVASRSFKEFFEVYLMPSDARPFEAFHDELFEIGQALLDGHGEMHNVIAAKEVGKSAILGEGVPIAAICLGKHAYIAIHGNKRAIKDRANKIVRQLTTNPLLIEDYGEAIKPRKDIKDQLEEFNDDAVIFNNDSKIVFLGPTISIRGTRHMDDRPSLYIIDDLHKITDFNSPLTLETQRRVVDESIACLDTTKANALCLSNVNQSDSVQGQLSQRDGWNTIIRPVMNENGEPLCWYTKDELDRKRSQVGEYTWVRDYECRDFDGTQQLFSWEEFDKFDPSEVRWEPARGVRMVGGDVIERCVVRADPARGFDKTKPRKDQIGDPDRFVVCCGAVGRSGRIYIMSAEVLTDSASISEPLTDRGVNAIARQAQVWSADEAGWENNAFQDLLGKDIRKRFNDLGLRTPVKGYNTHSVSKNARIIALQSALIGSERNISFSSDLPLDYQREWSRMRSHGAAGHDDCMDATEQIVRALKKPATSIFFGPDRMVAA